MIKSPSFHGLFEINDYEIKFDLGFHYLLEIPTLFSFLSESVWMTVSFQKKDVKRYIFAYSFPIFVFHATFPICANQGNFLCLRCNMLLQNMETSITNKTAAGRKKDIIYAVNLIKGKENRKSHLFYKDMIENYLNELYLSNYISKYRFLDSFYSSIVI